MSFINNSSNTKSLLELLDVSPWVNAIRYGIALNAIGTNAFLLFLLIRFPPLRMSQCNLLIAANASIELIIGIGTAVRGTFELYVLANSIEHFSHSLCVWIGSPLTGGFAANQVTILALALDRLMVVVNPFKFGRHKNWPFIVGTLLLTLSIFIGAIWLSLFNVDNSQLSSQCSMGANAGPLFPTVWSFFAQASTLLVFGLYLSLLALFYIQTRNNRKYFHTVIGTGNANANAWTMTKAEGHQISQEQRQQIRLTISVALILLLYTIFWALPTAIWFIFNLLDPTNRTRINYVTFGQGFLTPCGAGMNLYIYLCKHTEIKNFACSVIPWLKRLVSSNENSKIGAPKRVTAAADNTANNLPLSSRPNLQKPFGSVRSSSSN